MRPVLAAMDDSDEQISIEAVRVLSNWPTFDAEPHLLKLAQSDDLSRQVLGLRGYTRLAQIETSTRKKTAMIIGAMDLAKRPSEMKLVMAALGTLPTERSLDILLDHLEDQDVGREAASAIVAIAPKLADKERATAAIKQVLTKCEVEAIRQSARKTLNTLK